MATSRRAGVDLVSAGESFEDLVFHGLPRLPRSGEELRPPGFARTLGGGTLITAVAAARHGARVEVMSALPESGARRLREEGVRVRNLKAPHEPHAISVALSTTRDRAFVTFDGANRDLEARLLRALTRRLPATRHLHLALGPTQLPAWTSLLQRCRSKGIATSWDFGWHEDLPARRGFATLLAQLDWLFVNDREARHYAGAGTSALAARKLTTLARHTVIKMGGRGAQLIAGGVRLRVLAPRVRVVDTTGAGDAFNGGFLAALIAGKPLDQCLREGVRMGSLSTRKPGGIDALPAARASRARRRR